MFGCTSYLQGAILYYTYDSLIVHHRVIESDIVLLNFQTGLVHEVLIMSFKTFQSEKVISFVPPDGQFRLLSYHIGAQK